MPNVFTQWAVHYGGHSVGEFEQTHYLAKFPAELQGGCCMTLCCCWIASKGDIRTFKSLVNSKIGTNMVRGFQGLATKASAQASGLGGYFIGYILEIFKIFNIRSQGEFATRDARDVDEIARFIRNKPAFYQLHFKELGGGGSGHAIAFVNTGDSIQLFDPNYGLVSFTGTQQGGQFTTMLAKLLRDFYPSLNGRWDLARAYFP
jgi:hypothetical protein